MCHRDPAYFFAERQKPKPSGHTAGSSVFSVLCFQSHTNMSHACTAADRHQKFTLPDGAPALSGRGRGGRSALNNCQVIQYMHWDQVFTESMPAHNLRMRSLLQPYGLHKFPNQVRNDNLSRQKTKVGARLFSVFVSVMMKSAGPHVVH